MITPSIKTRLAIYPYRRKNAAANNASTLRDNAKYPISHLTLAGTRVLAKNLRY